jgi:hypothetical protein
MTSETASNASGIEPDVSKPHVPKPPQYSSVTARLMSTGLVIALLAVGGVGGASAYRYIHKFAPRSVLLLQPAPIAHMPEHGSIAIKGVVAEVFGNKFIVQDDSGRTLVDTGKHGDGGKLITKGETITVQGRSEHGFIHADIMTRADGTSEAFGSPKHAHPERDTGSDRGPGREPVAPRSEP